jgi:hypothetical protein
MVPDISLQTLNHLLITPIVNYGVYCKFAIKKLIFPLALQPPWALASDFQFHDHFTGGRTHWTSDQLTATQNNINTE